MANAGQPALIALFVVAVAVLVIGATLVGRTLDPEWTLGSTLSVMAGKWCLAGFVWAAWTALRVLLPRATEEPRDPDALSNGDGPAAPASPPYAADREH